MTVEWTYFFRIVNFSLSHKSAQVTCARVSTAEQLLAQEINSWVDRGVTFFMGTWITQSVRFCQCALRKYRHKSAKNSIFENIWQIQDFLNNRFVVLGFSKLDYFCCCFVHVLWWGWRLSLIYVTAKIYMTYIYMMIPLQCFTI